MGTKSLPINLDFRLGIPIYIQIVEQIQQLIANGSLQPDDQLPTVRQLAEDLRVNFNTIARAYRILDEDGAISTQHGRGTYVLAPAPAETKESTRLHALNSLTRRYLATAARMAFAPSEVEAVFQENLKTWQEQGAFETRDIEGQD